MNMAKNKKASRDYCVAGHRFGVTADEEYLRLMDNYEPFSDSSQDGISPEAFALAIVTGGSPDYSEELRQVDGEQTITCGKTSDGSPVFGFQWCGVTAGWLVCSDDYRDGRLIMTGRFRKLAIDNALMIMYAMATAGEMTALFHAAVVSLHGRGYMFLGPSGTGKSTHARLWIQHIPGAQLVNDDNPVVRIGDDGVAMVYGSPWSGKTRCYLNVGYPIGGIVELSQAPCNRLYRLSGIRAYAALMPAISGKRWDRSIADGLHATENRLAGSVAVWHMQCLADKEAAEMCESAIANES